MTEHEGRQEDQEEPRRPKVVDKRISARGVQSAASDPTPPSTVTPPSIQEPTPQPPPTETHRTDPTEATTQQEAQRGPHDVWTPEQEAEAQQIAEQIARVPAQDWVINSAVTLANVAGVKIQQGRREEAQIAIDAFAGLVDAVADRLGEAEAPLRRTLTELQLGFAGMNTAPPPGS